LSTKIMKFSDVAEIVTGSTPSTKDPENYGELIPFVKPPDLNGSTINETKSYLSKKGGGLARIIPRNSVLVGCIGSLGKIGIAGRELATNQQINALVFNENLVYPRYGFHYCKTIGPLLKSMAPATTVPLVNKSRFSTIEMPIPPLEEQKRIAAILDKADEIEGTVKITQNKERDMIRSAFLEMFGDPNLNPMNWDECTLESLCVEKVGVKAGPFGSSLKKEIYSESGYKIYGQEQVIAESHTIGDYYIPEDVYQRLESCKVESGDLLISLVGSIGCTLVIPDVFEPGIINPRLLRIRTKRELIHPDFLKVFLALPEIQLRLMGNSHGQTMPVLNGGIMKKISITTPPLSLQKKFLESLDNIDKMLQRTDRMVNETNKLTKSITQELLT
jgi:type I restriction enzyme, S subunit